MSNSTAERREAIRAEVTRQGFVRVSDLARRFGISRATAWRDVDQLAEAGLVVKFHGGATMPGATTATVAHPGPDRPRREGLTIGMQIPSDLEYYPAVIAGVRDACDAAGARLLVATSGYGDTAHDHDTLATLVTAGADGLLAAPSEHDGVPLGVPPEVIADLGCPVVVLERDVAGILDAPWEAVLTSYEPAVKTAFDHLTGLGHTRIGLVTVPLALRSRAHIVAAFDQIVANREPADHHRWTMVDDPAATFPEITASGTTAIIVYGDRLAAALSYQALSRGVDIPAQLSIVSIGDEVAANTAPPLTAISQRRRFLGSLAARRLMAHLEGRSELAGTRTLVDPEFVIRESTAPPVSGKRDDLVALPTRTTPGRPITRTRRRTSSR